MKFIATLAAVLSAASAIDLGHASDEQINFQIPSELGSSVATSWGLDSYSSLRHSQVSRILAKVAQDVGQSLEDIPEAAINSWTEVLRTAPQLFGQLKSELSKQLAASAGTSKKPSASLPASSSQWQFVVKNDEKFPDHALRVKSPQDLGIDTVKQYSGYLDVNDDDKHFFYWFFESRNDPKNDPIVLWLNGGPGCSSLTGLFFELGPASISVDLKPVHNPHAWNNNASVIFLDQPVNTGYSYSSKTVSDTVTAGKDVYAFLSLFFEQFPEYSKLPFHIAGESYAGHYIPVFANEIMSHTDKNFNLTSVLIGNGLTDPLRQYDYYEPMACGEGGAPAVVDEQSCNNMLNAQPRCNALIEACYNSQSAWTCVPATIYCNNAMMGPYQQTGRNVYDVREDCEGGNLCYPQLDVIDKYLNQDYVKEAVGAQVDTYTGCNFDTNRNFLFAGDWMKPYYTNVIDLLDLNVPVLIYAGDKDFICNWLGNEAWSRELPWAQHDKFSSQPLSAWNVNGKEAGQFRNADHFTFLRVYGAGHMVPYDQPEASLDMLNRWISGDRSFD